MKIREAQIEDAEQISFVHTESWRTTYQGIISESYLAKLSVENRKKSWLWTFDNLNVHEKIYIAEDSQGNIIGFANGGRNRNREFEHGGELYAIYLLKGYQGLGLGKTLFDTVSKSLKENGYTSMMLWVLKDNPALEFYKVQGGKIIGQKDISIGEENLVELAIGWDKI